ncbi:MAG: leucine-rich repeat domain-containing protein [Lachnospiraceae bacterium]|nr:leucine-rich repeat domain-containing protein [Lachnospiraceae bacterium]
MGKRYFAGRAAVLLIGMAVLSGIFVEGDASAAGRAALSHKNITIQAGSSKTLRLKNSKAKAHWSITAGRQYIKLRGKKRQSVKVIAVKKGTARVQAKAGGKKYTCKVTVTAKDVSSKRNAADIAAVKRVIKEQRAHGAYEDIENLDDAYRYFWDKDGRLTKINWTGCNLQGEVSVKGLSALKEFYCTDNQVQSLDVSGNPALAVLACGKNQLASLDVGNNPDLRELYCYRNKLKGIDVSANRELSTFSCYNNNISGIDVSRNTKLAVLDCNTNNLGGLDVSSNKLLGVLHCHKNHIASLDVTKNVSLTELACNDNQITELDVRNNVDLENLYCGGNQLKELDTSRNTKLLILSCRSNFITELDVSKNSQIAILEVDNDVEVKKASS